MSSKKGDSLFIFSERDILDSTHLNEPFRSDAFAIFLVQKGVFNLQCNLVSYALRANSVFFATPSALYETRYISPDISFVGLSFKQAYLQQQGIHFTSSETMYLLSSSLQPHCVLMEDEFRDMHNAIVSLNRKIRLSPQTPFLNEIIHHSFLSVMYDAASLFNRNNQLKDIKLNRKEELATSFLSLLLQNFKKQRSVQFYADALFITPRHLSKVIKVITGKTAGELIDEAVIKEAKMLLSAPSINVA